MTTESAQVVRDFIEAASQKDLARLQTLLTPDAVWEMPFGVPRPASYSGREAVSGLLTQLFSIFETIGFEDVQVMPAAEDGLVFVESRGLFVTAAGKPYRNQYVELYRVRDGQVCMIREYFNPIVFAEAFGIPLTSPAH